MSRRLATPKIPPPITVLALTASPSEVSTLLNSGYRKLIRTPTTIMTTAVMIGTQRRPPKKPRKSGSFVR